MRSQLVRSLTGDSITGDYLGLHSDSAVCGHVGEQYVLTMTDAFGDGELLLPRDLVDM